jgi:hypothetical protein
MWTGARLYFTTRHGFAEQEEFHRKVRAGHVGNGAVPKMGKLSLGEHIGELRRRRLLPVDEAVPESAGSGCPLGGAWG